MEELETQLEDLKEAKISWMTTDKSMGELKNMHKRIINNVEIVQVSSHADCRDHGSHCRVKGALRSESNREKRCHLSLVRTVPQKSFRSRRGICCGRSGLGYSMFR